MSRDERLTERLRAWDRYEAAKAALLIAAAEFAEATVAWEALPDIDWEKT